MLRYLIDPSDENMLLLLVYKLQAEQNAVITRQQQWNKMLNCSVFAEAHRTSHMTFCTMVPFYQKMKS